MFRQLRFVRSNWSLCARQSRSQSTRKAKNSTDATISEDVRRHFSTPELDAILRAFPHKLLRRKYLYPEHFYIADPRVAEQLLPHVLNELPAKGRPFVEVNPGPGLLTERLIRSKRVKDLHLYETNREFLPTLSERFLAQVKGTNVHLRPGDMLNLYRMSYQDKMDKANRIGRFLDGLPQRDWTDDPNIRMFACVGSVNFFKHMISSIVLQNDLVAFGRPELFLVMPPPLYIHLTCDNRAGLMLYRATSMLFQIMFTHKFIARVPRAHFLPYQFKNNLKRYQNIAEALNIEREHLYLVRIVPRRNLFDLIDPGQIQALWYFIKQNCVSRNRCVIPNLEKLIPGAGAKLILERSGIVEELQPLDQCESVELPLGSNRCTTMSRLNRFPDMNIFTTFGDLSPSQMLALFHQFSSWPGYDGSSFVQGLEDCLQKMELASAGIEDVLAEHSVAEHNDTDGSLR